MLAAMKLRFGGLRIGEEKKGSEEPMFASPMDDKTWQSPYILAEVVVLDQNADDSRSKTLLSSNHRRKS